MIFLVDFVLGGAPHVTWCRRPRSRRSRTPPFTVGFGQPVLDTDADQALRPAKWAANGYYAAFQTGPLLLNGEKTRSAICRPVAFRFSVKVQIALPDTSACRPPPCRLELPASAAT